MKKFLVVLIITLAIFSTAIFAISYTDLQETHWAYKPIMEMSKLKILSGYTDGTFAPDVPITRAEFAKILVLSLDLKETSTIYTFDDVSGHWANEYIKVAATYLPSISSNLYKPDDYAVREDVTMAIVKAMGLENAEYKLSTLSRFSDEGFISENLKKYIAIAIENDLMHGNEDGTFNPKGNLTRAEVSQLMVNALSKKQKENEKEEDVVNKSILPTKITLSEDSLTMKDNETIKLVATIKPNNATDKNVTWTSSNEAVATVDDDGLVTIIKSERTVTITATTVNGKKATCKIKTECNHRYTNLEYKYIDDETHMEGITCSKCVAMIPETQKIVAHTLDSDNKCKCGYEKIEEERVESSIDSNVSEDVLELLEELNIMSKSDLGKTFDENQYLMHAEAVSYVVLLLNNKQVAKLSKGMTSIKQVPASHWASGYYYVAKQDKLFKGLNEDEINPEENITSKELITMVVNALGYGNLASSKTNGYMLYAKEIGLLEDVGTLNGDEFITRGATAKILYNALNSSMWDINNKSGEYKYEKTEKTLKEIRFGK